MNRFLLLVILCVGLAVLRAVAIVLIASVVLGLTVSLITRPKQTLVFLGTLALSLLTVAQPLACIVVLGLLGLAFVLAGRTRARKFGRHLNPRH